MTAPDLAAIIARSIQVDVYREAEMVRDILAAKVPALCPTCGGDGEIEVEEACKPDDLENITRGPWLASMIDCPDCPTIAKLLAIGAAVMSTEIVGVCVELLDGGRTLTRDADELLTYLRTVQP